MQATLTICIPAYEDAGAVERALTCILKQTWQDWECLIGDDSVSDAVQQTVQGFSDKRIRYFRHSPRKGVPANWNHLLSLATGKYVTLLHQDDFYINANLLETIVQKFEQGGASICVCAYSTWKKGNCISLHNTNKAYVDNFLAEFPRKSLVLNRIGHPSVIFLKNAFAPIAFDPNLTFFLDTDWYARLWKAAGTPVYVPDAEVGIEIEREFQLSVSCTSKLTSTLNELHGALRKWHATTSQIGCSVGYFFTSYMRFAESKWKFLISCMKTLSPAQRGYFLLAIIKILSCRLARRGFYKTLPLLQKVYRKIFRHK